MAGQPRARTTKAIGNGSVDTLKIDELDHKVACLIWLHAEQHQRLMNMANAVALLLTQAAQPQVQQSILGQLLGGNSPDIPLG